MVARREAVRRAEKAATAERDAATLLARMLRPQPKRDRGASASRTRVRPGGSEDLLPGGRRLPPPSRTSRSFLATSWPARVSVSTGRRLARTITPTRLSTSSGRRRISMPPLLPGTPSDPRRDPAPALRLVAKRGVTPGAQGKLARLLSLSPVSPLLCPVCPYRAGRRSRLSRHRPSLAPQFSVRSPCLPNAWSAGVTKRCAFPGRTGVTTRRPGIPKLSGPSPLGWRSLVKTTFHAIRCLIWHRLSVGQRRSEAWSNQGGIPTW